MFKNNKLLLLQTFPFIDIWILYLADGGKGKSSSFNHSHLSHGHSLEGLLWRVHKSGFLGEYQKPKSMRKKIRSETLALRIHIFLPRWKEVKSYHGHQWTLINVVLLLPNQAHYPYYLASMQPEEIDFFFLRFFR